MRRAVVIGGSIAGMSTARALKDFFDEVLILERDLFPDAPRSRPGVPQSHHAHALLERGHRELEALFPGFSDAVLEAGGRLFDFGERFAIRRATYWQNVGRDGFELLWASRNLIEFTLRRLLRVQTVTRLRDGVEVQGLQVTGPPYRVHGVRVRSRQGATEEIDAELVVDASGRASRCVAWLAEAGLPPPPTSAVDARCGYASRLYLPASDRARRWSGMWIESRSDLPRGGAIFPIEHGRWLVTAVGVNGDYPPTDELGFMRFLESLPSRALSRALVGATPLSPVVGNRSMANALYHYDRWRERPRGLLAVGDAVCTVNPIYGQGMTCAAACAGALRRTLQQQGCRGDYERFFLKRQAAILRDPWLLTTGADFQWPGTVGERPKRSKIAEKYLRLAMETGHLDGSLHRQLTPVYNLAAPVTRFFAPRVALRVLLLELRRWASRVFQARACRSDKRLQMGPE
ncbi:MAG: hypothetical protein OXU20_04105 [Myxococcales bacterium]|nr:hypothetical protein [Myxococcales bacterium]